MGAVQAQNISTRCGRSACGQNQPTAEDVEQAIADGKLCAHGQCAETLHFVPAEDAKWMVKLSAPRLVAGAKRRSNSLSWTAYSGPVQGAVL